MLSQLDKTQARLLQYKEEKAAVVDPLDDDGSFPSFKEWCTSVESERQPGDYRTVTVAEADKAMEDVLEEVDNQPSANVTKESDSMNNTTDGTTPATEPTAETTTAPAATSKPKRVRKPVAAKSPAKPKSKADTARAIFKRMSRGKTLNREKIIAAFVNEAKLSAKGAATYYQSLKGKGGKKAA